jgi:hypothetical protein
MNVSPLLRDGKTPDGPAQGRDIATDFEKIRKFSKTQDCARDWREAP